MAWKKNSKVEQRFDLVRQIRNGTRSITELCRQFQIGRTTAYKWRRRYRSGRLGGLMERSRRPHSTPLRTTELWRRRIRQMRRHHPTWGARKLAVRLAEQFGLPGAPAVSTISRWLKRWGLTRGRRRRKAAGPVIHPRLGPARRCNEVWTVDFKGFFRTQDGRRVDPLTVRDLYSRYGLCIVLLTGQRMETVRRQFVRMFKKYGMPERIRCDNGAPFGGGGPTRLTQLSGWWLKLGIEVEFTRPGCPCDNGSHEQYHRMYKAEVTRPPALDRGRQQRRSNRWLWHYNWERPHQALGMKRPGQIYQKSRRRYSAARTEWQYPKPWIRRWVKGNGEISWKGWRRYIGEAFAQEYVGLKPVEWGVWQVYYGPWLVGELFEEERGAIRPARHQRE